MGRDCSIERDCSMGRDHSDCVISHCLTKTSPPILQYTVFHSGWSGTCENHKGWTNIGLPQQTRLLDYCWAIVVDDGPALIQHCVNAAIRVRSTEALFTA